MVFEFITDLFAVHWILLCVLFAAIVYQFSIKPRSYFRDQSVPHIPGVPIFGSQWRLLTGKENLATAFQRYYNMFPDQRFFGIFEMLNTPVYVIRDPELIKQIGIKDFDHFTNHRALISEESDPLLGRSMVLMRDDKWRDMRSTVSPAFTGSKMRLMLALVSECAQRFVEHLKKEVPSTGKDYDMHDLFSRFVNDAIATSAFGLNVNSLEDRDNEFYLTGAGVTNVTALKGIKFLCFQSIPRIAKLLKLSFFTAKESSFFRNLVHGTMKYREEHNEVRHDMINLMMQARKGSLVHKDADNKDMGFATVQESDVGKSKRNNATNTFEDDDLVAQCMIFFLAGFNAVSSASCFMAHELTVNPDIQAKLLDEITELHRELDGKPLTYDSLQSLKYLDQIVSETLRRWPITPFNDRLVTAPYTLRNDDGTSVQLNVGDSVYFSSYAVQMDPKYYPDPERFDPERFSDANKDNIKSGTYLPFGIGPRNCIGSRYALMAVKALFYHLVLNLSLEKGAKTQHPLVLSPAMNDAMKPVNGFWSELRPR